MKNKQITLHLISFDIPYPPNYGGVIDVFYKIKQLSEKGVEIILHCYEYGRTRSKELNSLCTQVYYYKRENNFNNFLSRKPYIVKTRNSQKLIENLTKDEFPILFEGLHTTGILLSNKFDKRKTIVRTHNIEHEYYKGLKNSESNFSKKLFFKTESIKLKKYEKVLHKVNFILTISPLEHKYFSDVYGTKSLYVPVFFNFQENNNHNNTLRYSLWHGDLSVSDNQKSLKYIVDIYKETEFKLIIASSKVNKKILTYIQPFKNIEFQKINSEKHLDTLLEEAHIHPLVSFQNTGIKLRLLNILSKGKHVITNNAIIEETGLEKCVHIANKTEDFYQKITQLSNTDFTQKDISLRNESLQYFNPTYSAEKIIDLIE